MSAVPAAGARAPWWAPRWALLGVLVLAGGCVDKAPPPLWPAPPPPSVATPITSTSTASVTDTPVPVLGVVGAPALAGPSPLDAVPAESSILDPASPAATAVPKTGTTSPRPVPGHK